MKMPVAWIAASMMLLMLSSWARAVPDSPDGTSLPQYQARGNVVADGANYANPFATTDEGEASRAVRLCPHVCLLIPYGQNAEDVVAQFESSLHCQVQAGDLTPVDHDMQFSQKGMTLLEDIEKLRLNPYDDQTGKEISKWVKGATIGYGHLISKHDWKSYESGITQAQAQQIFTDDLAPFVNAVNQAITVPLSQQQFDAMVILAYNIGVTAFNGSAVVKLVNDPDAKTRYANLEDAWKAWKKSQGKVSQGLVNRRNAEWKIYTQGIYETW